MHNYGRLPVRFVRGEGALLWDDRDRRYLDALSGIAVCGLGHAHPAVSEAICDQARTLVHTSNLYEIPLQERLAAELCTRAGLNRAFFCNSGAEANEAAIKLARLHARGRGIAKPHILVMENSFHGRTLATLTATGNARIQAGFEPLVEGFTRVPYNDLDAVRRAAAEVEGIVAVLVEPVQGEGGIRVPSPDYLAGLRAICDEQGWLLMLDEIQTGIGRTGEWFAFQHAGILPDVLTLAKGLGNGFPIGACLARGAAAELFQPGHHGTTFGGNPLGCRTALAVLETMEREQLPARAAKLGSELSDTFRSRLGNTPGVSEIRGHGLLLAIALDRPCGDLVKRALERGLLINVTAQNVIRLLPPLIFTDTQADELVETLCALVTEFLQEA
ncbi:acetylornithine transaminase [Thiohalobacter thiocyanaticus]|uniref:Acetylornithine aminotransferase n=2 Tax=Thiohalobacter thiocyanaticus TaxID=585455 RepID=A0A426QN07_9GAMM|nr:acetylornithine transaminase [Thiohalobacter thiocyanaticus]